MVFYMTCWHLKDWIVNDDRVPAKARQGVRDASNASLPLRICHDVAIGAKHYTIERPEIGTPDKTVAPGSIALEPGPDGTYSWHFEIVLPDGSRRLAHELARDALRAWMPILQAQGLIAIEW